MSNTNAVVPFLGGTLPDALESLGVTQFPSGTEWFQTIGGLLVQGGKVDVVAAATASIEFPAGVPTQLLGIWIQTVGGTTNGAYVNVPTLAGFDLVNGASDRTYYWWALGV